MKRIVVLLLSVLIGSSAWANIVMSNSEVSQYWRSKSIKVTDGGATPDVMTLLKAFHQTLPTWVVGEVVKQEAQPAKGTRFDGNSSTYEEEEGLLDIIIDRRNGYVGYLSPTDVDQVTACVWRKNNGHRIFAVSLYDQHDPVQNLLCWYDYDPQTQTLTPSKSPIDSYQKPFERMEFSWTLPRKGTDFIIHEYYFFPDTDFTQVYSWDGETFHRSKTLIDDFCFQYFGEGDWIKAGTQGFTQYALVDIDHSGSPALCLKNNDNWIVVNEFRGKMQTVTVCDEATMLESMYHVVPEAGKPWTEKDVVVYTSDFEHVHYYVVLQNGSIGYIITSEPNYDEEEGRVTEYASHKNGYGAKDESIDIIHADRGEDIFIKPQWKPFSFIEREE